ncbi:hypothetical protein CWD92_02640 [Burkholderia thailandensis]|nr:hypothetical protein A8H32_21500 [Burkholderia thailandensis]PJO73587.1 hypothetical protein CWD92_02640 [Burkholderia thailandensis]
MPSCPAPLAKRGQAILRLRRLETHHVEAVARHRADARLPDVEARLFRTSSFRLAVRTTLARNVPQASLELSARCACYAHAMRM